MSRKTADTMHVNGYSVCSEYLRVSICSVPFRKFQIAPWESGICGTEQNDLMGVRAKVMKDCRLDAFERIQLVLTVSRITRSNM